MKIVAINGSHRGTRGYTDFLIEKFLDGARAAGAECEKITLAEMDIRRCTGCFVCQKKDHIRRCIYDKKDDGKRVFERIKSADALVFASPIYIFTISSLLLNLFNRFPATCDVFDFRISKKGLFFHDIDKRMLSKPFVTILCQDNVECETHKNAVSYFKTYSKFMEAPYGGSLVRMSAAMVGRGMEAERLEKYSVLKEIYQSVEEAGRQFALEKKIRRGTQKKANQPIVRIPFFVKLVMKNRFFRERVESRIKNVILSKYCTNSKCGDIIE